MMVRGPCRGLGMHKGTYACVTKGARSSAYPRHTWFVTGITLTEGPECTGRAARGAPFFCSLVSDMLMSPLLTMECTHSNEVPW